MSSAMTSRSELTLEARLALAVSKLQELAHECATCSGTAVMTVVTWEDARVEYQVDCEHCDDIRDVIARCLE